MGFQMATRTSLILTAALAVCAIPAHATISRAMSFDEKVDHANAIILGKVISQQSQWDESRRWILTYSTFEVEKSFKGAQARQMTIVTPGGRVGDLYQDTVGIPKFQQGGEHVLFVRSSQAGPTVLYFDQGAYDVVTVRGERFVKPAVSAAVLIDTQRGMAVAPEGMRPLREFESSVRDTVRKREALRMEMVERKKQQEASLLNVLYRNRTLVALALIGALLATWQLVKRW
jgi:hypothetical protein